MLESLNHLNIKNLSIAEPAKPAYVFDVNQFVKHEDYASLGKHMRDKIADKNWFAYLNAAAKVNILSINSTKIPTFQKLGSPIRERIIKHIKLASTNSDNRSIWWGKLTIPDMRIDQLDDEYLHNLRWKMNYLINDQPNLPQSFPDFLDFAINMQFMYPQLNESLPDYTMKHTQELYAKYRTTINSVYGVIDTLRLAAKSKIAFIHKPKFISIDSQFLEIANDLAHGEAKSWEWESKIDLYAMLAIATAPDLQISDEGVKLTGAKPIVQAGTNSALPMGRKF